MFQIYSVRTSGGWIRGVKGFLLYTSEDPGVIKARPHIIYLINKGLTSNGLNKTIHIQYCLPEEAPGSVEALSSPVLVLDGGGVCSSRADELATIITD